MAHASLFSTSLGACAIAWDRASIIATSLPDATEGVTLRRVTERTGATKAVPPPWVLAVVERIEALLNGERVDLSEVPCTFGDAEPLYREIYAITRRIPPGTTTTYGAIAAELGDTNLARSVGQAMGRNPIPIIVPCHRVIGADGKLVGFSADGGVSMKLRMLEIERARIGDTPTLFDDLPFSLKPGR